MGKIIHILSIYLCIYLVVVPRVLSGDDYGEDDPYFIYLSMYLSSCGTESSIWR